MRPLLPPALTRRALLLLAALSCAASAQAQAQAQQPRRGGTLVVGYTQTPRHLNGAVQSGVATALPSTQLFASPLRFDDQWRPQPYLAERWTLAPDGLSLTLHLRRNALFHDGKPVTSDDVAFSILAIKANHPFQSMFAAVDRVDTPDAHTAVIRMSQPHPAILHALSPALAPILPRHVYGDGQDLKLHPRNGQNVVGSGPFRLVEFVPGQRIVMERFDRFFLEGRPLLDRVIIRPANAQSLSLALERGEVDMLPFESAPTDLLRLKGNPEIVMTTRGYEAVGAFTWLHFNLRHPLLKDVRARQAIAHVVDKDFIVKGLHRGVGVVRDGPLVPGSPFASTELTRFAPDPARAEKLLDEAGFKRGANGERARLTIDYVPGNDDLQKTVAEYVVTQLRKVGVTVTLRSSPDFPTWARRMAAWEYDMTMDVPFSWPDPVIGVHRFYLSGNVRNVVWTNTGAYVNPKVDELLARAAAEPDTERRRRLYAEFQKIVSEELPHLPIESVPYHTATTKKVGNVPVTVWGPLSPLDEVFLK